MGLLLFLPFLTPASFYNLKIQKFVWIIPLNSQESRIGGVDLPLFPLIFIHELALPESLNIHSSIQGTNTPPCCLLGVYTFVPPVPALSCTFPNFTTFLSPPSWVNFLEARMLARPNLIKLICTLLKT